MHSMLLPTIAPVSNLKWAAAQVRRPRTQTTGLRDPSRPSSLVILTTNLSMKLWAVWCATRTSSTTKAALRPLLRWDAANTHQSRRSSTTSTIRATKTPTLSRLTAHSLVPIFPSRLRALILIQRNGKSLWNHSISLGKLLMFLRATCTKVARRVLSLKCSDGPTLTSKLSVRHSAKWAGWEWRFSLLRNQSSHLNGLRTVSSTHGGSTTSQLATNLIVVMAPETSFVIWSKHAVPMVFVFMQTPLSITWVVVAMTFGPATEMVGATGVHTGVLRFLLETPLTSPTPSPGRSQTILVWCQALSSPLPLTSLLISIVNVHWTAGLTPSSWIMAGLLASLILTLNLNTSESELQLISLISLALDFLASEWMLPSTFNLLQLLLYWQSSKLTWAVASFLMTGSPGWKFYLEVRKTCLCATPTLVTTMDSPSLILWLRLVSLKAISTKLKSGRATIPKNSLLAVGWFHRSAL